MFIYKGHDLDLMNYKQIEKIWKGSNDALAKYCEANFFYCNCCDKDFRITERKYTVCECGMAICDTCDEDYPYEGFCTKDCLEDHYNGW